MQASCVTPLIAGEIYLICFLFIAFEIAIIYVDVIPGCGIFRPGNEEFVRRDTPTGLCSKQWFCIYETISTPQEYSV